MINMHVESRTMLKWALVLVLIGVAVFMGHLIHSRMRAQEVRAGGPIPYTVILRETLYYPNGTSTVAGEYTQAVRSDGSFVWRYAEIGGHALRERGIQFASGVEVTIDEIGNTKSTQMIRTNLARMQRDPSSKCVNSFAGEPFMSPPEVFSGEETVAGYRTVKLAQGVATGWYAVDCGCAMVKSRHDWGGGSVTEKNLVALIPGEPDAALFDVPATAKEVPPSERILGSAKKRIRPGPDAEERLRRLAEQLRVYDEYYYKHRPKQ
ncbi:MAG: hypothetical protein RMM98_14575 [Acidobacteriota bacterium]|nr:hypothetical protein [Blastocatellia bacterium]MDW8240831.1 hypothetical protein [Acidobacteriota bacterium]